MSRRCNVYLCRRNYPGEPYTKKVHFPRKQEEKRELNGLQPCRMNFGAPWKRYRKLGLRYALRSPLYYSCFGRKETDRVTVDISWGPEVVLKQVVPE